MGVRRTKKLLEAINPYVSPDKLEAAVQEILAVGDFGAILRVIESENWPGYDFGHHLARIVARSHVCDEPAVIEALSRSGTKARGVLLDIIAAHGSERSVPAVVGLRAWAHAHWDGYREYDGWTPELDRATESLLARCPYAFLGIAAQGSGYADDTRAAAISVFEPLRLQVSKLPTELRESILDVQGAMLSEPNERLQYHLEDWSVRKGMCERLTSAFAATPYKPQPVADAALSAGAPPKRRWWFWK